MKLFFKEDPNEWRKNALLTTLGLALLSSLLRWQKHLAENYWRVLLIMFAVVALCAMLRPRWFRGWYRFSLRLGFHSSQLIGHCVLALFFIFIITPVGFAMRLIGKDTLQLNYPHDAKSYWHQSRDSNPLDRLF
jgi:hypothetical protein